MPLLATISIADPGSSIYLNLVKNGISNKPYRAQYYETILSNNRRALIADELLDRVGTNLGFLPSELLCSALATCTCVTLRMYADRKKWPLEGIRTTVNFERNAAKKESQIRRAAKLTGPLTEEQQ